MLALAVLSANTQHTDTPDCRQSFRPSRGALSFEVESPAEHENRVAPPAGCLDPSSLRSETTHLPVQSWNRTIKGQLRPPAPAHWPAAFPDSPRMPLQPHTCWLALTPAVAQCGMLSILSKDLFMLRAFALDGMTFIRDPHMGLQCIASAPGQCSLLRGCGAGG